MSEQVPCPYYTCNTEFDETVPVVELTNHIKRKHNTDQLVALETAFKALESGNQEVQQSE